MALEILSFIVSIREVVWAPIRHHLGYLVHYRRNLESLKVQIEKLEAMRNDNQVSVDAAVMNNYHEEIKCEVKNWVQGADAVITEVEKLNDEVKVNKKCFVGWCPDLRARYKLSRKAVKVTDSIRELQAEGRFDKVSHQVRRPLGIESTLSTGDFEVFESTKQAMDEVMEALKNDKVNVIGVYGMGGVGKTTMVKQVGARAYKGGLFDQVITAEISQNPNLRKIQGQLADMLALKLEEESESGRAGRLKERIMRGKRILVILDNLWRRIELSEIGIPSGSDLEVCESKIILTTRLENVCHAMGSQAKIPLKVLSQQDSRILFRSKAGKVVDSPNFCVVATKVSNECDGLPIALVVVARSLGDKDLEEWEEAARRLQMSKPTNLDDDGGVFECIKLSYDYLKGNDTKPLFLICCLFPEDSDINIEELVKYGMGQGLFQDAGTMEKARGEAHSVVKYLKASSLLLDSEQEGCVKMHDVVRDMAILIASSGDETAAFMVQAGIGLKEWPKKDAYESYTAISLMWNEISNLPDGLLCPKLQTLLLQNNSNIEEIPDAFFERLKALRVLDLSGIDASLPPSLGLLTNLRTLCLDRCQSTTDISILGELNKLEILSLRESCIEALPEEIGQLANLRMLDLSMSNSIKSVPPKVISSLFRLEELCMQGSFGEWGQEVEDMEAGTNAGFDELTCLTRLNILKLDVSDADCMPKHVRFDPNWVKFDICISRNLFTRLMNVHLSKVIAVRARALVLDTTINSLPDWFNKVVTEKAEKLFYINSKVLDNILVECDQRQLNGLKSLLVQNCNPMVYLMNAVKWTPNKPVFESLEELRVHNMEFLKEICVGQLPHGSLGNLKFLEVQQCPQLVNALLPSNLLQRLQNLEVLDVSGNSSEEVFRPEGLEEGQIILRKLKELKLENLPKLKKIWNGPAQLAIFRSLKILTVIKCKKLRNLFTPAVSRCLQQLEELWVEDCNGLEGIIGIDGGEATNEITPLQAKMEIVEQHKDEEISNIVFPHLKYLSLQNLSHLTSFYSGFDRVECPSLEQLHVQDCPNFRTSTYDFNSRKQVQVNNEQHLLHLRKRLLELRQFS